MTDIYITKEQILDIVRSYKNDVRLENKFDINFYNVIQNISEYLSLYKNKEVFNHIILSDIIELNKKYPIIYDDYILNYIANFLIDKSVLFMEHKRQCTLKIDDIYNSMILLFAEKIEK